MKLSNDSSHSWIQDTTRVEELLTLGLLIFFKKSFMEGSLQVGNPDDNYDLLKNSVGAHLQEKPDVTPPGTAVAEIQESLANAHLPTRLGK